MFELRKRKVENENVAKLKKFFLNLYFIFARSSYILHASTAFNGVNGKLITITSRYITGLEHTRQTRRWTIFI